MKKRDVLNKIGIFLEENTTPTPYLIRKELEKGMRVSYEPVFGDFTVYTARIATELWHYFDSRIVGDGGLIFKKNPNNKTLADELWDRIGQSLEDSEHLTDKGLKKLKNNFYKLVNNKLSKFYNFNNKRNAWEFIY